MLRYTHPRASHNKRRDSRNIECRLPIAARAAGIQQRLAIQARIDANGHPPHSARESHKFVDSLALHAQRGKKCRDLRCGNFAREDTLHGLESLPCGKVMPFGNCMKIRQKQHVIVKN